MGVLRHMITRHMITMSSVNFQPHSFENASLLLGVQVVEDMKPRSDYGTTIGQKTAYSKFWVCTTCPMHLMPAGVNKTCLHWQVGSKEATNNNLTPNKKLSYVWSSLRNHNGMNLWLRRASRTIHISTLVTVKKCQDIQNDGREHILPWGLIRG